LKSWIEVYLLYLNKVTKTKIRVNIEKAKRLLGLEKLRNPRGSLREIIKLNL